MLAQLPIFLAMFNLFNTHFELRGAMFIPGWITDLSVPEYVWMAYGDAALPLLGWNALRILPFIYVGSQLLYGKAIQTPAQMGNPMMMKMMLYVMPLIFFFVLYEMPSGLLLYWIMSNLLTLVQQMILNKFNARKKALAAANAPVEPQRPVIAPGPRKKKKR
jgi:YidC/Oxa1 family membrane protein insertase